MNRPALGVYGLSYRIDDMDVLSDVSFELERGEILCLLGPNGSGKSTLLKTIAGLLPLRTGLGSGHVRQLGDDFLTLEPRARARRVAYIGAELQAEFPLTAAQAVALGRSCHASPMGFHRRSAETDPAVRAAMEKCFCWSLRDQDLHTLSGGERQLVSLARGLAQGARVLLLDEALSKMDLNHQAAIGKVLTELAKTGWAMILVSHDLNVASEWASSALLLKRGKKIAHGPIREILTSRNMELLYPGANLSVAPSPTTGAPKVYFLRE